MMTMFLAIRLQVFLILDITFNRGNFANSVEQQPFRAGFDPSPVQV